MASDPNTDTIWYFAYGSNLSPDKFTHSRGIVPLASAVVRIPGWRLSMSIPGLPYREPAFASIEPIKTVGHEEKEHEREVEGVAYLITRAQYVKVVASEGGDIAYAQAKIRAEPLRTEDEEVVGGNELSVLTLVNAIFKAPPGRPSLRYMDLVMSGAEMVPVTPQYLRHLQTTPTYTPGHSLRNRVGASLFLLFWSPVMALIETIVKRTVDYERGGVAPDWVKTFIRFLVASMWFSHEIHALVWGRGDGLDDAEDRYVGDVDVEQRRLGALRIAHLPWTG